MTSLVQAVEIPRRLEKMKSYEESMLADSRNYRSEIFSQCTATDRKAMRYFDRALQKRNDLELDVAEVLVGAKEFLQGILIKTGFNSEYIVGDWMQYDKEHDRFVSHVVLRKLSVICHERSPRRYTY